MTGVRRRPAQSAAGCHSPSYPIFICSTDYIPVKASGTVGYACPESGWQMLLLRDRRRAFSTQFSGISGPASSRKGVRSCGISLYCVQSGSMYEGHASEGAQLRDGGSGGAYWCPVGLQASSSLLIRSRGCPSLTLCGPRPAVAKPNTPGEPAPRTRGSRLREFLHIAPPLHPQVEPGSK